MFCLVGAVDSFDENGRLYPIREGLMRQRKVHEFLGKQEVHLYNNSKKFHVQIESIVTNSVAYPQICFQEKFIHENLLLVKLESYHIKGLFDSSLL